MSDTLRDMGYAVIGLTLLTGFLKGRAEHALRTDIRRHVQGGRVDVRVEPRGWFGLLVGESGTTEIRGRGFAAQRPPFYVQRGGGIRGAVGELRLDFEDVRLGGLAVRRLHASIPRVSLDAGSLLFRDRIVARASGSGRAEVRVGEEAVAEFVRRRLPQAQAVVVRLVAGEAHMSAGVPLLGRTANVELASGLTVRDGRAIYLDSPRVSLDGKPVGAGLARSLLAMFDPVVDIERDLGLRGFLVIDRLEIHAGELVVFGRASIPDAPPEESARTSPPER